MGESIAASNAAGRVFRMLTAFVLCFGLMVPTGFGAQRAYADASGAGYKESAKVTIEGVPESVALEGASDAQVFTLSVTPASADLQIGCGYCPDEDGCGDGCIDDWGYCSCTMMPVNRVAYLELVDAGDASVVVASLEGMNLKVAAAENAASGSTTTVKVRALLDAPSPEYDANQPNAYGRSSVVYEIPVSIVEDLTAPVSQTAHSVDAYREAQYGTPPYGDSSDAGQHVKTVLEFDGEVVISDPEALKESLVYWCNMEANSSFSDYTVAAEGSTLVLDGTVKSAIMGGNVKVAAAADDGILEGITVDGHPVKLETVFTTTNTGLAFEAVEVVQGTDSTPASTTYRVTHSANVRSMNHIVWMSNGTSVKDGVQTSQTTAAHHHTWYNFTLADSANSIASGASSGASSLQALGYTVSADGDEFTVKANSPKAGEIVSAAVYGDAFLQANRLSFDQKVEGVATPNLTGARVDLNMAFPEKASGKNSGMYGEMGNVAFTLTPDVAALDAYKANGHADATMADMMNAWADAVSVTADGMTLAKKPYDEWDTESVADPFDPEALPCYDLSVNEAKDGKVSVSLTLPSSLFDTSEQDTASVDLAFTAAGFQDVSGTVSARSYGADSLLVRQLDGEGNVVKYTRLSFDELAELGTVKDYRANAICGMAGLRSFRAEGVYLSDVLDAAGIDFAEGMTLKARVNDMASTNDIEDPYSTEGTMWRPYSYDYLYGKQRYYFPDAYSTEQNTTLGMSINDAIKKVGIGIVGDSEGAAKLRSVLGDSSKVEAEPFLAWAYDETFPKDGTGEVPNGTAYNKFSADKALRFLFGLTLESDGSLSTASTSNRVTYGVFGIDVVNSGVSAPAVEIPEQAIDANGETVDVTVNGVDGAWMDAEKSVYVNGQPVDSASYSILVADGKATVSFASSVFGDFDGSKEFSIEIVALGGAKASGTLTLHKDNQGGGNQGGQGDDDQDGSQGGQGDDGQDSNQGNSSGNVADSSDDQAKSEDNKGANAPGLAKTGDAMMQVAVSVAGFAAVAFVAALVAFVIRRKVRG